MNSRYIKIAAIITMTIDHVGLWLLGDAVWARSIGRIAMPLFCLLVAFGVTKTRNKWKYFLRLFAFASVIQVVMYLYDFSMAAAWWNVFFTLSFGVGAAGLLDTVIALAKDKSEMRLGRFLGMATAFMGMCAFILVASIFPVDYGSAGVILVVLFYIAFRHSVGMLKITAVVSLAVFNIISYFIAPWSVQWWAFLVLPFIFLFTDKKLKISVFEKYAFYLYYPLHFVVIFGLSMIL